MKLSAEDKIRRAIIQLNKEQPFFAMLSMHLKPKLLPKDYPMQSMGVDARGNLYYAEEFVEALNDGECKGVICHEVMHVALLHFLRQGNRFPMVSNIAQDIAVNSICLTAGLDLPDGGIPVDTHQDVSEFPVGMKTIRIEDVSKKTWEEMYAEILAQLPKGGGSGGDGGEGGRGSGGRRGGKNGTRGDGSGGWDNHIRPGDGEGGKGGKSDDGDEPNPPLSPEELRKLEQEWQGHIADAADHAKRQGHLPAGMERIVDGLLKPKIAWKQLLLKYLRPFLTPVDWSYQRPHRKSQALGVYMPNTLKEYCEVEVLIDTSGSIGGTEMQEFLSEIIGIAKSMQHVKMWVNFCDTQIHARYEVDNGDIPKILAMKPMGGGGTSMETGLDEIKVKNPTIPVTIILTDGYDGWRRTKKDYPFETIWVISERGITDMSVIPYGLKVKMGV